MSEQAKQLHRLRKQQNNSKTMESIGILLMTQLTDNHEKLERHVDLAMNKGKKGV